MKDKFDDTIMHFAARDGQLEILEYIINKSKKLINNKNQEGKTALRYAIENGHITCAQYLRNNNAVSEVGNRAAMIKDLAQQFVNAPADYRKSVISKQTGERIEKSKNVKFIGR